jgi:hypothetical protein
MNLTGTFLKLKFSVMSRWGVTTGVRFPAGAMMGFFFCLRHRVHTGSGAHPVSYSMGTGGSFPGDKVAGT